MQTILPQNTFADDSMKLSGFVMTEPRGQGVAALTFFYFTDVYRTVSILHITTRAQSYILLCVLDRIETC